MKNFILAAAVALCGASFAPAQRIDKPTLTPQPCTERQKSSIQQAVALHDAKRYDSAVEKYQEVIDENPGCTPAIYELALTLYTKGDKTKAMETAYLGSKYKSDELPLIYMLMASILDDVGKPDEAVKIYKDALKILGEGNSAQRYVSSVNYNLGITYLRQKKYKEARDALKAAIENDFAYPSPHLTLAELFVGSGYRIPALLAALRFVSIEFNTERSKRAAAIISSVLGGASAKPGADGKTVINLDFSAPTDEGDFGPLELVLGMADAGLQLESAKPITSDERFAAQIDSLILFLGTENKKNNNTFVAKRYYPFLNELKARNYVEPLANLILAYANNPKALKWIVDNNSRMSEFAVWAKNYQPKNYQPKK